MLRTFFNTRNLSDIANDSAYSVCPKHIFGEFCFENDLHVLAGDTNVGKTILGFDMALSFSNNVCSWEGPMSEVHGRTLYVNFEMSNTQVYQRYHNAGNKLLNDIMFSTLDSNAYDMESDTLVNAICNLIEVYSPGLVIIDNLSCLIDNSAATVKTSKVMSGLKCIKEEFKLTMVVIAHFKKRNRKKPISVNEIYGSSAISKIADSISAMGSYEADSRIKYLKMLKNRSVPIWNDVAVLEINDQPYLHMNLQGYDDEENYISGKRSSRVRISDETRDLIIEAHNSGFTVREIAELTGCSKSSVGRFVKALDDVKN